MWLFWDLGCSFAVTMAWYEHGLLPDASAQISLCAVPKMIVKTGPAKTGPARPLATAMYCIAAWVLAAQALQLVQDGSTIFWKPTSPVFQQIM